ncbi:MAG: hypothetical protein Q4E70_01310 [Candidatus Saccharibacteria bacterium]|nr:hypothetical protein [Candidatus Saccharibacteria bacterium]
MEDKICEYEKFIKNKTDGRIGPIERVKLAEYHKEMVLNFQHERLIHLLVTFFFGFITFIFLVALGFSFGFYGLKIELIPLYVLTILLTVLEFFYVKHYYFLENHVQGLYKYTKKLRLKEDDLDKEF